MPETPHEIWEYAAANRARLEHVEAEVIRNRDHIHDLRGELAAVRYLGEKVADLATSVDHLGDEVLKVSRRAVERPTRGTMAVLGQYLALGVAIVALIFSVTR